MNKTKGKGGRIEGFLPEISISRFMMGDNGSTQCRVYITESEGVARRTRSRTISDHVEAWPVRYERV